MLLWLGVVGGESQIKWSGRAKSFDGQPRVHESFKPFMVIVVSHGQWSQGQRGQSKP